MPWPQPIIDQFYSASLVGDDAAGDFVPAYESLLHTFFPADKGFTVVPEYYEQISLGNSAESMVASITAYIGAGAIFFLGLKPPDEICSFAAADRQVRERILKLAGS